MEPYKVTIWYRLIDSPEKTKELVWTDTPVPSILETFIIESIMKDEKPDILSIYPLIKNTPRGTAPLEMPSNRKLMDVHGIESLEYEIDGRLFRIST